MKTILATVVLLALIHGCSHHPKPNPVTGRVVSLPPGVTELSAPVENTSFVCQADAHSECVLKFTGSGHGPVLIYRIGYSEQ